MSKKRQTTQKPSENHPKANPCSIGAKATLQVIQKNLAAVADRSLKDFQVSQKYLDKLCNPRPDMQLLKPVNERYFLKVVSWY